MPQEADGARWTRSKFGRGLKSFANRARPGKKQSFSTDSSLQDDLSAQNARRVYINVPVPAEDLDQDGNLKASYPRNKIRTARFTALTFIPLNLWLQFHNLANIYFVFVVILNFFPIFGANNPGLNAVPIIVIIVVTAIKDAIEDWRRTVLDNELNNSHVWRLLDWENPNSSVGNVSTWRRIKKATTHSLIYVYGRLKSIRKGQEKTGKRDLSYAPSMTSRPSFASTRDPYADGNGVEMASVNSRAANPFSHHHDSVSEASPIVPTEHAVLDTDKSGSVVNQERKALGKARFKQDYWKNIQVGDFVRLYDGDEIPADVVILSCSDPDGISYVETKNLDGETNLKARQALKCGRKVKHAHDCEKACFVVESEPPNESLFAYSGAIRWEQQNSENGTSRQMVEPITINNLLLRGTILRNTTWVLGVVAFTGSETKIMLNSGATPSKRPRLAKDLNGNALLNFAILFIMCIISGFINGFAWKVTDGSLRWFDYGSYGGSPALEGFVAFWVAMILFQNLVPIALYISQDIMRIFQSLFIHFDRHMYYERLDMACIPKRYNISDDIGQIEYIFSDKTGTLTQNVMELKKCTVNGVVYGESHDQDMDQDPEKEEKVSLERTAKDRTKTLQMLRDRYDNPYLKDDKLTFVAPSFVNDLNGASGLPQQESVENFLTVLALCNTVFPEHVPADPPDIIYKAESPDDAALVDAARDYGTVLSKRKNGEIVLNIGGKERKYTILNVLDFTSARKRMSIIVKMADGTIRLLSKGADSVIYSRLYKNHQEDIKTVTSQQLEAFAVKGLRTLCVAERVLDPEQYRLWNETYELASQALVDRDGKVEQASSAIEQDLILLGGTGIEDRLQDGVPKTISMLADAGIKLWVLTGDKVETAINIGFSCNLLNKDMELLVFNNPETASAEIRKCLDILQLEGSEEELVAAQKDHGAPKTKYAMIIDGETLTTMLDEEMRRKFLLVCKQCRSVLCCRVSPAQKAAVVELVKSGLKVMALAIGDGANDVSMIQEADIGVGIAGEEGRQAVMASDYAIGQFEYLQRLVLVHGRWSYRRLGEATANFFYKNLVWTFALFWYSIYNNFDGSYLFDYTYIVLVNVVFTSLPVIFMGIFDQDVSDAVSLAVPQLYVRGIERKEWGNTKFALYMLDGFYQSIMCFFMPYMAWSNAPFQHEKGLSIDDRPRFGIIVAHAAVICSNTYVLLNSYRWDWLTIVINIVSSLLIFFWTGVYSTSTADVQFYESANQVYSALTFWATLLVTVFISLLPRLSIKAWQKVFFPTNLDIIREQVRLGKFKHLGGTM